MTSNPSTFRGVRSPWLCALVAGSTLVAGLPAFAQAPAKNDNAPAAAPERVTVFALEKLDVDRVLIDPKDAALKKALGMLPARLRELPGELPDVPIDQSTIDLIIRMASAPMRLAITYNPQNQQGGLAGFGVVLSFAAPAEADAAAMQKSVEGVLAMTGAGLELKPSPAFDSMREATTPFAQVRMGPRKSAAGAAGAQGWNYEIHVGSVGEPDAALSQVDSVQPGDIKPFARARFDAAPLSPLLGMLTMFLGADPASAAMFQSLTEGGFIGPDAAHINFVVGHLDDRAVSEAVIVGIGDRGLKGGLTRETLTDADYRLVPADSAFGGLGVQNADYFREQMKLSFANPMIQESLDQARQALGFDPIEDMLLQLGSKFMFYTSDATGGGTLGSFIAGVSLADKAKFADSHDKLVKFANGLLASEETARGYVQVRAFVDDSAPGVQFFSLRTPGLPIPAEPTWALAGDWLLIGFNPQATIAAARQAVGKGDAGILSNPAVAGLLPKGQALVSATWAEPQRTLRGGYPFLSFFGSFVRNGVTSRADGSAARDPGLVVPTFADLARGARGQATVAYWKGDDYVTRWEGDKSLLVNMGTTFGVASTFMPVILGIGAAAAAAVEGFSDGFELPREIPEPMEAEPMDDGPGQPGRRGPQFRIVPVPGDVEPSWPGVWPEPPSPQPAPADRR